MASLYKKAKKSFILLFIYTVSLILFLFVISDALDIATGVSVYIVLAVKWVGIFTLLSLISFSVLKIFNIASNPFDSTKEEEPVVKDSKREKILSKQTLQTKSDLILQKYMKDS